MNWTLEALPPKMREQAQAKIARQAKVRTHTLATPEDTTRPKLPESAVLKGCLELLRTHPKVAFCWRQNVTTMSLHGQMVKFGFKGCSDILAVLNGGRFLSVECKATGMKPSDDQRAFLDRVRAAGGLATCVDDPANLAKFLEAMA